VEKARGDLMVELPEDLKTRSPQIALEFIIGVE
jgi:hypothetical protein